MKCTIKDCLNILPKRYHDEFLNDVIVDEESIRSLKKVFTYYLAEIIDELSFKEKEPIYNSFFVIKI